MQQQKVIDTAKEAYTWAITNGIAKEQARCVLPEGNTVSRLYMNGTLRSWIHYLHGLFTKGRTPKQTKTAFLILLKLPLFIIKIYYKCIRPKRMFLVLNQFKILTNNSITK